MYDKKYYEYIIKNDLLGRNRKHKTTQDTMHMNPAHHQGQQNTDRGTDSLVSCSLD